MQCESRIEFKTPINIGDFATSDVVIVDVFSKKPNEDNPPREYLISSGASFCFRRHKFIASDQGAVGRILKEVNDGSEWSERRSGMVHVALFTRAWAQMLLPDLARSADRVHTLFMLADDLDLAENFRQWISRREPEDRINPALVLSGPAQEAGQNAVANDMAPPHTFQADMQRVRGAFCKPDRPVEDLNADRDPPQVAVISFRAGQPEIESVVNKFLKGLKFDAVFDVNGPVEDPVHRDPLDQLENGASGADLAKSIMRMSEFCAQNRLDTIGDDLMTLAMRHLILDES